jgi:hypothetical protein
MRDVPTSIASKTAFPSATQVASTSSLLKLFSVLSKPSNMKIFLAARDGLKVYLRTSLHLKLSRRQYYKALKQVKEAGLIQKRAGTYFHTLLGKIIYQKDILDLAAYTKYSEGMQVLDAIKSTSQEANGQAHVEDKFMAFIEKLTNTKDSDSIGNTAVNTSPSTNTSKRKIELAWTYEEMTSLLLECIDLCKDEILIATRISSETIIKTIQQKSKEGTKVKVLADEGLIKEYFRLHKTNNLDLGGQDKNAEDRIKVISNPWYPEEKNIERKICQIPFGMIIIDGKEIGIELIDQSDPHKFRAGILLRDEDTCAAIKEYYQKIWDNGYSDLGKLKEHFIDK